MVDPGVGLRFLQTWWDEVNGLAAVYGVLAVLALLQLIRIHWRVPERGWTTQQVFYLLHILANGAVTLLSRQAVQELRPEIYTTVLQDLDLPGLLFFSTYSRLVLLWAETYHQARRRADENVNLRPAYLQISAAVYVFQAFVWFNLWWNPNSASETLVKLYSACVSLAAAAGILLYGERLFLMVRGFPIKSKGRRYKLWEVGSITGICSTCFTVGSIIMSLSIFSKKSDLHTSYYMINEIIPSAYVMYLLRKLPAKTVSSAGYKKVE